jgi:mRNA interferase MazF
MGSLTVGDVVIMQFPYADFKVFKKRPALVIGIAEMDCSIICQISSKRNGSRSVVIDDTDFEEGGLRVVSYVRPDKIYTAQNALFVSRVGRLDDSKITEIRHAVTDALFN